MKIEEIKKIMEGTCWKSLSYCCSLDKKCKPRDEAIKKLNMSSFEYIKLKKNFDKEIEKLRNKK